MARMLANMFIFSKRNYEVKMFPGFSFSGNDLWKEFY